MKITPRQYATALYDTLTASPARQSASVIAAFVDLLKKHHALSFAPQIIRHFTAIADAADGTVRATVTMAQRPDDAQDTALRAFIAARYGAERADVRYNADPTIRGGFVIRVGDEEYDASVTRRLRILARQLTR